MSIQITRVENQNSQSTLVLKDGQPGYDTINKILKIGDGQNVFSSLPVPNKGKKTCRFVIGTTTNGWTSADCDYLCDGNADDVEINQAIRDLPPSGGTIVLLDGTYNINSSINITNKKCILCGGLTTIETSSTFKTAQIFYFYLNSDVKIYNINLKSTVSNVRGVSSYGDIELYYCTIDTKDSCIVHNFNQGQVIVSNCNIYCSNTNSSDIANGIELGANSGHRIYNNIITGCYGIYLWDCSNCSIYNNQIDSLSSTSANKTRSIFLQDSNNNLIHNNKLWTKYVEDSNSSSNNFSGNVFPA